MNRSHVPAALAILGVAAGITLYTAAAASAHDSGFTITPHCSGATWTVDYTSTATNPELNPQAYIANTNAPLGPIPGNFTTHFVVEQARATFTATTRFVWSDGFTKTVGPKTVNRPACDFPPVSSVPPPMVTTVPVATTIPAPTTTPPDTTPPATTIPEPATTVPAPATTLEPPVTVHTSPTSPPAAHSTNVGQLPATGADSVLWIIAAVGVLALILGLTFTVAHHLDRRHYTKLRREAQNRAEQ